MKEACKGCKYYFVDVNNFPCLDCPNRPELKEGSERK